MLLSLPSLSYAATGSVHIRTTSAGFIVGVGGGSDILHFRGRNYPLSVGGMLMGPHQGQGYRGVPGPKNEAPSNPFVDSFASSVCLNVVAGTATDRSPALPQTV
jgi:hypothetical protein